MSTTDPSGPGATLGQKNLSTIHAVAQSLAIGPMFSTALLLGLVSNPATGAGWNATLAILLAGLGVLAIGYCVTLYARRFAGAGAVYEYLTHGAHPPAIATSYVTCGEYGRTAYESPVRAVGGDHTYGVVVVTAWKPRRSRIGRLSSEASTSR